MRRKKRAEAPVPRETVERAARVYSSNTDAAAALGIAAGSFGRLCRRHGIEPPQQRRRRARHYTLLPLCAIAVGQSVDDVHLRFK